MADRVDDLLPDLQTLKHFTTHGQWALLRMCINQRPVYLQRLLLARPSNALMQLSQRRCCTSWRWRGRTTETTAVSALRCLPLQLSRGAMRSIARTPTHVKALDLCRDNIARFLKVHAETEGHGHHNAAAVNIGPAARSHPRRGKRTRLRNSQLGPARARARKYTRRSRPRKPHRGQARHKRDNHPHRSQDTSD
jgi:hypothetical protein